MDKFSFESLKLLESHFKLNTNLKPAKNEPIEISFQIGISHKKEDKTVNVTLSVDWVQFMLVSFVIRLEVINPDGFS